MTFTERKRRIRTALRNGYEAIGHREEFGENKWSQIYEYDGDLKYARGSYPQLKSTDLVKINISVDVEKWDLGLQKEVNRQV